MSRRDGSRVRFRTFQAICDLRVLVGLAGERTLARIAAGVDSPAAEDDLRHLIGDDGCCIRRPQSSRLHQGLVLAATLPDDDFHAFQTATAILLADRLQGGMGEDNLFWHWDAFREHYLMTEPHVRAALTQGFSRMQSEGLVTLQDPPGPDVLLTEDRKTVAPALDGLREESANVIRKAFDARLPDDALWLEHCAPFLDPAAGAPVALLRGIRHLFESHHDWEPLGDASFDPAVGGVPVIPVVLP